MKLLSMLIVTLAACLSFSGAMAEVRSAAVAAALRRASRS